MKPTTTGDRTLTELDHVRLAALLRRGPASSFVQTLIEDAELVPSREVEPDVVTMYSMLLLAADGPDDQAPRRLVVCYPFDAEPEAGFLSVLSPLGAALIGRRVGDHVRWHTPDGRAHAARIVALPFQPEASGDYTT